MLDIFSISPGHHHFKQYYYQEWEERPRYIHDHIYSYYLSQDHAKNMNGGVWPTDFSKIRFRPGGINYIYNILTGYHYKAPYGLDVPTGKYFNPYFDHMVIGMKPVLSLLPSQLMTAPSTTMTELLPPIHKWHMMWLTSLHLCKGEMVESSPTGTSDYMFSYSEFCFYIP